MKRIGGDLRYEDFTAHKSAWVDPVTVNYRGYTVAELPPNGQGAAALQMLKILEGFDLKPMGAGSAAALHVMIEAKRLVYEDLAKYYADPAFSPVPVEWLISDKYATARRALIKPDKNNFGPRAGFSWSLDQSARTVLRASVGLMYEPPLLDFYDNAILSNGDPASFSVTVAGTAPGAPAFPTSLAGVPSTFVLQRQNVMAVDPDFKTQSAWLSNVQVEHAILQVHDGLHEVGARAARVADVHAQAHARVAPLQQHDERGGLRNGDSTRRWPARCAKRSRYSTRTNSRPRCSACAVRTASRSTPSSCARAPIIRNCA